MVDTGHQILIVGGGTAGITVAARLLRKGQHRRRGHRARATHYYQPLWTLVGGGQAKASTTARSESSVMPKGATWIKNAAVGRRPRNNTVTCADGATGRVRRARRLPGHPARLGSAPRDCRGARPRRGVDRTTGSTSRPRTWDFIRNTAIGHRGVHHAVRADQVRRRAAEDRLPGRRLLAKAGRAQRHRRPPRRADTAAVRDPGDRRQPRCGSLADYGITVHTNSEVTSVDAAARKVDGRRSVARAPTPCSPTTCCTPCRGSRAPDWIKSSPLPTGDANGYVDIDKHTMQHVRYPNVFSLGDAGSIAELQDRRRDPQAGPRRRGELLDAMAGRPLRPRTTATRRARSSLVRTRCCWPSSTTRCSRTPSIPLIDTTKERRDMGYFKRYGLPALYWHAHAAWPGLTRDRCHDVDLALHAWTR